MVLLALVAPSLAATLVVSSAGPYTSIGAAITAAASGDTISVAAGTWTECVDTAGKDLTVEGAGLASTTLTASAACESAFVVDNGESVTLRDLTITHPSYRALAVSGSTLALDGVKVANSGSYAYSGAGLSASAATITAKDSVFSGNTGAYGAAIYAVGTTSITLTDTELSSNAAYYGSAAFLQASGGTPYLQGHTWDVGQVASIVEARAVLARRLPVAATLHGAALLDD